MKISTLGVATVMGVMACSGTVSAQIYKVPDPLRTATPRWIPVEPKKDFDFRNRYAMVNMLATDEKYKPAFKVDPEIGNAWGLALRPVGKGGHWWLTNAGSGTSTVYLGDSPAMPFQIDPALEKVEIPVGNLHKHLEDKSQPTGIVFAGFNEQEFVVEGEGHKGASRFIFVTLDGTIGGWIKGQTKSVTMVDIGDTGSIFVGCAISDYEKDNRLYVVDYGDQRHAIRVYDKNFKPVEVKGDFKDPNLVKAVGDYYEIYNLKWIDGKLYAAWGFRSGEIGEAQQYTGYGFVSVFDAEGRWLQSFESRPELNNPWGFVKTPKDFGALSNRILVGNFGDGRILAYHQDTGKFDDYLRDVDGKPIEIDGLWDLHFGNGDLNGYANHLYYAGGPEQETQGVFGKLVPMFP